MLLRLLGYLFGIGTFLAIIVIAGVAWYVTELSKDLPDYEVLNAYEPPVTTRVHAGDGALMAFAVNGLYSLGLLNSSLVSVSTVSRYLDLESGEKLKDILGFMICLTPLNHPFEKVFVPKIWVPIENPALNDSGTLSFGTKR